MGKLNTEEEKLLTKALTFFVDYKFKTNHHSNRRYCEIIDKEDDYKNYYKLCKKLGGKPQW